MLPMYDSDLQALKKRKERVVEWMVGEQRAEEFTSGQSNEPNEEKFSEWESPVGLLALVLLTTGAVVIVDHLYQRRSRILLHLTLLLLPPPLLSPFALGFSLILFHLFIGFGMSLRSDYDKTVCLIYITTIIIIVIITSKLSTTLHASSQWCLGGYAQTHDENNFTPSGLSRHPQRVDMATRRITHRRISTDIVSLQFLRSSSSATALTFPGPISLLSF